MICLDVFKSELGLGSVNEQKLFSYAVQPRYLAVGENSERKTGKAAAAADVAYRTRELIPMVRAVEVVLYINIVDGFQSGNIDYRVHLIV